MGRFLVSGAPLNNSKSNKNVVTCSSKHSRSSTSFFNLMSEEIRKIQVQGGSVDCTFSRWLHGKMSTQVSETNDEGIKHVPQRMRPHTGRGRSSATGGGQPPSTCLSRQHPTACKWANLLLGVSMQGLQGQTTLQHKISQASWFNIISKVQTHGASPRHITGVFISPHFLRPEF